MFAAEPAECRIREDLAIPRARDYRPHFAIELVRWRSISTPEIGKAKMIVIRLSISGGPDR